MSKKVAKALPHAQIDQSNDGRGVSEYAEFTIKTADIRDQDADTAGHQGQIIDFLAIRDRYHVKRVGIKMTYNDSDENTATNHDYQFRIGVGNNTPGNVTALENTSQADWDADPAARGVFTISAALKGLEFPLAYFAEEGKPRTLSLQSVTGLTATATTNLIDSGIKVQVYVDLGLNHV